MSRKAATAACSVAVGQVPRSARAAPLCTSCAYPAPHVYTTYSTRSNIRLGVCRRCGAFIDPLIEAPPLLLVLDLVLLKPRVFLHLLFNRGTPPLDARGIVVRPGKDAGGDLAGLSLDDGYDRRKRIRADLCWLGAATLAAESAVRLLPTCSLRGGAYIVGRVSVEMVGQMAATTAVAMALLALRGWYPAKLSEDERSDTAHDQALLKRDGRQEGFLPSLIPLVLLYTAVIPLLLQLVLGVWYTPSPSSSTTFDPTAPVHAFLGLIKLLAPAAPVDSIVAAFETPLHDLADAWRDTDRVWAGTRLLSGMSAGFGLRVLLPTKPWETTLVVVAGWYAALLAGRAWDALWLL